MALKMRPPKGRQVSLPSASTGTISLPHARVASEGYFRSLPVLWAPIQDGQTQILHFLCYELQGC